LRLKIGSRVGAYEISAPVGSGGMGEVYRAHDARVGRDVALKVLPDRLATDKEAVARFVLEAKAVAALSHPNILALYEFEQEGDLAYVVTELLEGETLRELIKRGPISWRRAVEIGTAIADGLSAAHAKGIVHRDLKPENVFITTVGHVKLLDFGLAQPYRKPLPASEHVRTDPIESGVFGTVGYMAPEQIGGATLGPSTDIFALGCVLYEAVSGRNPFAAETSAATIAATMFNEPPELPASVPPELARLIRRCLQKHPDARFQSAGDLAFALHALETGPRHRVLPIARPGPKAIIAASFVVLIIVLGAIVRMRAGGEPAAAAGGAHPVIHSLAVVPLNSSSDRTADYLSDGITDSLVDDLSHLPDLVVVSRTSVFNYKGKAAAPQTIARDLNVEALLTVRVVQLNDALRISTELVDGRSNRHLWGEQVDTRLVDLASARLAIAREISERLAPQLSGAVRASVARHYTGDSEAYRLYLEGRYEWNKRTGDGFERAIRLFDRAIQRDPRFALAWAGLADCYLLQSSYYEALPSTALPLARHAAQVALSIDEQLAEAHSTLGYVKVYFDGDLTGAAREFERAIQLNPNYATARQWYSHCLMAEGRYDDAIRESRRAEALDPLSLIAIADTAGVYSDSGRLDSAIAECRRALDMEPDFPLAHYVLAGAYLRMKRYDDAAREANLAWRLGQNPRSLVRATFAFAKSGRMSDARDTLARLERISQTRFVSSYHLAALMIATGRESDAPAALRRAAAEMPAGQYRRMLEEDPALADVRNDARFLALAGLR
jgi:serine/threonine protein kinase/tetratricopeptide (TPR) repeat protein